MISMCTDVAQGPPVSYVCKFSLTKVDRELAIGCSIAAPRYVEPASSFIHPGNRLMSSQIGRLKS